MSTSRRWRERREPSWQSKCNLLLVIYAPALISAWAVLESLARLASALGSSRGYSPIQAVQALAEDGYIENEEAQRLREMARLRSAVVHGDFSVNVSAEQVEFLLKQLKTLKSYITNVAAEQAGG